MISIEEARSYYQEADTIHDFDHVLRVYELCKSIGKQENADWKILSISALLHDACGAAPGSKERMEHHLASALLAEKVLTEKGWLEEDIKAVMHCIRAHRYRGTEMPQSLEAKVLFDADKLDVLGAIGVARVIGYAAIAGEPHFSQPSRQFLDSGEKEPGEPHSAYHEYLFKLRNVKNRLHTDTAQRIAEERDTYLSEYFVRLQEEIQGLK
ncbi:MAG: HD domain-containing protein [Anaerolineaceae bacterium]|nr:HD domain-containing protein [Anaerolineaceae bacterium]